MSSIKDVLIVGAGPTGLTLAINLLRNGINCCVIEKRQAQKSSGSKAITVNAASLKLYHNIGIIDKFLEYGCMVNDIYVHWNQTKLMHINYRYLDSQYKYFLSIPQPESESILLQYFLKLGGRVDFGTELINIDNTNTQHVRVTLLQNGINSQHAYRYVVGCDGAKSKIRETLGSHFIGRDYGIFFELIDVDLNWDGDKNATHYFVVEDCFIIIIPMVNNKHRIVFKNNIDDIAQMRIEKSVTHYEYIVHQCGVLNLKIKNIFWRSFSKFYNRLIDNYNYGERIFFAGDSCHLFSPIGGIGMNTGLQDAFNLSWRLSGVLFGKYNPQILMEYNTERRLIGNTLIKSTDASTELITRISTSKVAIENWLPIMRNRINIKQLFPLNFSGLAHNYIFLDKSIVHVPFARGICLKSNNQISTYDIIDGINFHLLLFSASTISNKQINTLQEQLDCNNIIQLWHINKTNRFSNLESAIFDEHGEFYTKFGGYDSKLVLIRPDGYIELECSLNNIIPLSDYLNYLISPSYKDGSNLVSNAS